MVVDVNYHKILCYYFYYSEQDMLVQMNHQMQFHNHSMVDMGHLVVPDIETMSDRLDRVQWNHPRVTDKVHCDAM